MRFTIFQLQPSASTITSNAVGDTPLKALESYAAIPRTFALFEEGGIYAVLPSDAIEGPYNVAAELESHDVPVLFRWASALRWVSTLRAEPLS